MTIEIINIRCLVGTRDEQKLLRGSELATLPCIENAWLTISDGRITGYGPMNQQQWSDTPADEVIDASGQFVCPCWCDSHTHLLFAASREEEFVDKIKGLSYADIAAKGGGILNSARKLQETPEADLLRMARTRLFELIRMGTGAIEIKSGYGLTVESELKMLRVIRQLQAISPIPVKSTFLGAHTYPTAFRDNHEGYIQQIIGEMLPAIAAENLADYIDVFCENGFFFTRRNGAHLPGRNGPWFETKDPCQSAGLIRRHTNRCKTGRDQCGSPGSNG